MKSIRVHTSLCLLAFLLAFVHGDAQAKTLGLDQVLDVTPPLDLHGLQEIQLAGPEGLITLPALPFVVVETHQAQPDEHWLLGYEAKALGPSRKFWRVACGESSSFKDLIMTLLRHPLVKSGFPDVLLRSQRFGVSIEDPN